MENNALFKSVFPSSQKFIRTFQTPEGMFRAILTPEKEWRIYKCLISSDKYLKTIKCSEYAHNKTLYKRYILD